jgi:hypothetical protein
LDKFSKDQSVISNDSAGGEFRTRVVGLFEKFKSNHLEILKQFEFSK